MRDSRANPSPAFLIALAVLIALGHALLAVTATASKSTTADEIAHLTAGATYNRFDDFRLQPENGNLPQRWAALPATLMKAPLPSTRSADWQKADVWNYGHAFLYEQGLSADTVLFTGRAMITLFSVGTGLLVFFWSRRLFGWQGAFVSLVLFAFSPTFLAHGALTTSDMAMTFFFLASATTWWRHLETPGAWRAAVSALTLGGAFVAKFSAVLLPPMLALIGLVWFAAAARNQPWPAPLLRLARTTVVHALVVWGVIWLAYGFRFSAFAPDLAENASFNHGWHWLVSDMGPSGAFILWIRDARLLPEAWLYGLTFVLQFSRARGAFMSGDYSVTGWVTFFPWAFLIKTTIPALLLFAGSVIGGGAALRRHLGGPRAGEMRARLYGLTPLLVLFVVYWATSITSNLNIGHRHILPTYPVLFIAAGWLGPRLSRGRPLLLASVTALGLWHIAESVAIRPHYLAYFNQVIGGPANGWRHLVDSSLDWGQDLPELKRWMNRHAREEKAYLAYFGTGDPGYEGIRATPIQRLPALGAPLRWEALGPGIYAISATLLQHVYSPVRGPWTVELEREYQDLRRFEPAFFNFTRDDGRRAELEAQAPRERWLAWMKRHNELRFARLCHYLRARGPDANAGYSILIFRLDAEELASAISGSATQWQEAIERAERNR